MDRRAFFAALGGVLATTSMVRAQQLPLLGDVLGGAGNIAGAGLAAPGQILGDVGNGLGGFGDAGAGLGGIGQFGLADLMGGAFSIETSKLALQRSRSRAVREFAQLETNEQMGVTAALGATPGSVAPRPDQQAMVAKLARMGSGPRFDHAYILGQIKGHEELLQNNTQAIDSPAVESAVRRVATLSVPTIQTHLAILHRLRAGLAAV